MDTLDKPGPRITRRQLVLGSLCARFELVPLNITGRWGGCSGAICIANHRRFGSRTRTAESRFLFPIPFPRFRNRSPSRRLLQRSFVPLPLFVTGIFPFRFSGCSQTSVPLLRACTPLFALFVVCVRLCL